MSTELIKLPQQDEQTVFADYLIAMSEELTKRKMSWHNELISMFARLKGSPESLADVQAELLSNRQRLTEEVSFIASQISKENARLKKRRSEKMIYYSTGVLPDGTRNTAKASIRDQNIIALKKTKSELDIIISGDLSDLEALLDHFIGYITYLRESVKSVDHSLYGVKNRIELLNIIMGNR